MLMKLDNKDKILVGLAVLFIALGASTFVLSQTLTPVVTTVGTVTKTATDTLPVTTQTQSDELIIVYVESTTTVTTALSTSTEVTTVTTITQTTTVP